GATLYYTTQTEVAQQLSQHMGNSPAEPYTAAANYISSPSPIFLPLSPFTVTLHNERTSRVLHVAITLRVADEASRQTLDDYMPEVRDRVLNRLSEQHPIQVQTAEGRAKLASDLSTTLQIPYLPQIKGPSIQNVLFTAFVVQ